MNFDSIVPDLIAGTVTGLVVGLALYLLERRRERRDEIALVAQGVGRLTEMVAPEILAENNQYSDDPAELTVVDRQVLMLLRERPIHSWAKVSKDPVVNEYLHFQRAAERVLVAGRDLHFECRKWLRQLEFDPLFERYLLARCTGLDPEVFMYGQVAPAQFEQYNVDFVHMMQDPKALKCLRDYETARNELSQLRKQLRDKFQAERAADKTGYVP